MYSKINGIQHVGLGVKNHKASWKWLRKYFKMDIPFFNAVAEAPLMDVYTHGKTINKRAAMVMNLKGGGAMEVVSPVSFEASVADFEVQLGDIGIFSCAMKSDNIEKSKALFSKDGIETSEITSTPDNKKTFFVQDDNGLYFQVIESNEWYSTVDFPSGGVAGTTIAVTDINKSLAFYSGLLGFSEIAYDETAAFSDFGSFLPNGEGTFRRVKLVQPKPIQGPFSTVGGELFIELVQSTDNYQPKKMWKGRIWGDVGFLHLGMDVKGMKAIGEKFAKHGHGFTCDTKDALSMGATTKVHCTYVDDPDGILIEMIEVFKIPLIEKMGVFLNLEKRKPEQPLPKWLLSLMKFMRVKD